MLFELQTTLEFSENDLCILQNDKTSASLKKNTVCTYWKNEQGKLIF